MTGPGPGPSELLATTVQLTALSSLAGLPQVVLGQTGPGAAASIVGPPGSDAALLALAQAG